MKRCIIIGSGLGGLSCGSLLSRNGYDVTVLEQGHQAGGCLQSFERFGAKFETGMHFIGSVRPGEVLDRYLRFLGINELPLSPLDRTGYNLVKLGGEIYRFANSREGFISQMSQYFPKEAANLERYFNLLSQVASASALGSSSRSSGSLLLDFQRQSLDKVLDRLFTDPVLQKVLVGDIPLYAAQKGKSSFAQHAFLMDFYNRSSFRIVGGSDIITDKLVQTIEANNGHVLTNRKVTAIRCDSSKATSVEINGNEEMEADLVVSDIHPTLLMSLLDTPLLRPAFKKRLLTIENTSGVFSLFIKFKPGEMPYLNSNFFSYAVADPWDCENYSTETWPSGYLLMHSCTEEQQKYAKSAVVLSYMRYSEVARWENTHIGNRGEDYKEFKRNKAAKLIAAIEKDFPGFSQAVENCEAATPLTYRDYTGTVRGSIYGVAHDVANPLATHVPFRTRIPNLFLTGQNVNSHGILGVIVSSIITCNAILGEDRLMSQLERFKP